MCIWYVHSLGRLTLLRLILFAHLGATLYMLGVIWMVQLSHYPLMALVGRDHMSAWQAENLRRTSWVVGIPMLLEAGTAGALLWSPAAAHLGVLPAVGGVLLVAVWGSTALVQVPAHESLARSLDPSMVARLVSTNWVRTALWSVRAGLAVVMVNLSWGLS